LKKFIYCAVFLFLLLPFQFIYAEIYEIASIAEILPFIDDTTLLVFDVDNTLIEPLGNLGSDQWYYYIVRKYVEIDKLSEEEAHKKTMAMWNKVQWIINLKAVEPTTPEIIKQIQTGGIQTIGLTARTLDIADKTLEQLHSIDVCLNCNTIYDKELMFKCDDEVRFKQGIIFVGENNNKGKVLVQFLQLIDYSAKKIVYVDDKMKHVVNVENALKKIGVPYIGFRYGATDAKVAEFQTDTKDIYLFSFGIITEHLAKAIRFAQEN